jgi:hypothetical protein
MALSIVVRKNYEMTRAQCQALVDFEVWLADMGLKFWMHCRQCHLIGDPTMCDGDMSYHAEDGTATFSVTCRCQTRAYRGHLACPPSPKPLRKPRTDLTIKPEVALTRADMKIWQDAADVMHQLKVVAEMRCMACQMENRACDGVYGNAESSNNMRVLECDCTRRVYRGSDAPIVSH